MILIQDYHLFYSRSSPLTLTLFLDGILDDLTCARHNTPGVSVIISFRNAADTFHIKPFDKQQNTLWQTFLLIPTRMTSFRTKGPNKDHAETSKITTWGMVLFMTWPSDYIKLIHLFLGWHKQKGVKNVFSKILTMEKIDRVVWSRLPIRIIKYISTEAGLSPQIINIFKRNSRNLRKFNCWWNRRFLLHLLGGQTAEK